CPPQRSLSRRSARSHSSQAFIPPGTLGPTPDSTKEYSMKKYLTTSISRSAVMALMVLLSSSAVSYAYLTDGAVYVPLNYYTFNPPALGGSYVDAMFGSTVKRLSSARTTTSSLTAGNLGMVTNEYATM